MVARAGTIGKPPLSVRNRTGCGAVKPAPPTGALGLPYGPTTESERTPVGARRGTRGGTARRTATQWLDGSTLGGLGDERASSGQNRRESRIVSGIITRFET